MVARLPAIVVFVVLPFALIERAAIVVFEYNVRVLD